MAPCTPSVAFLLLCPQGTAPATAPASEPQPRDGRLFEPAVAVLHEWVGEAAGDQFGWIGRNAGDCDGDRVNDVLLSAPSHANGGPWAGRVYVYSGKSGTLLFRHDGQPGDQLGAGIERAGDVNKDGFADVIAGAPGAGGPGQALVLSGRDGALLLRLSGEASGDSFGRKVGEAGDANGDGHTDLLVGADQCDSSGADAGRAYLLSGKDGSRLLALDGEVAGDKFGVSLCGVTTGGSTWLLVGAGDAGEKRGGRAYVFEWRGKGEAELVYTVEADETGVGLGRMFVSFVGDVDADGFPDAYVSDWENNARGPSTGRVYVLSGRSGERLHVLTGEHPGDGFGIGTADVGDVDGDGHADLLIGAWQCREAAPSGGKCYLYSGKSGAILRQWTCTVANETFGFDTTGMGDVNGDGSIDFLVTSAWSGIAGKQSGRAFLLSGKR